MAAGIVCALTAAAGRAAEVEIDLLSVNYDTQTATSASGSIDFNLRFGSLAGDLGNYNLFSAQVLVDRLLALPAASFTLDTAATQNVAAIGSSYWLSAFLASNHPLATTVGSEFRFEDWVLAAVTPPTGDILAHFVIGFDVTSPDQFGAYAITMGDPAHNKFVSGFGAITDLNTITNEPVTFNLTPEPGTAALLLIPAVWALRRRNLRSRR